MHLVYILYMLCRFCILILYSIVPVLHTCKYVHVNDCFGHRDTVALKVYVLRKRKHTFIMVYIFLFCSQKMQTVFVFVH